MSDAVITDGNRQVSDKALMELKLRLDPFFKGRNEVAAAATASGWRFNVDNEGGWGYVIANSSTDISYGEYGMVVGDTTGHGVLLVADAAAGTETLSVGTSGISMIMAGGSPSKSVVFGLSRSTGDITAGPAIGGKFNVYSLTLAATVLSTDETTGVTTGSFDGGTP